MKSQYFYQTLSAVVAGVLIASFSFYALSRKENNQIDDLKVERYSISVPDALFIWVVADVAKSMKIDLNEVFNSLPDALVSSNDMELIVYNTENKGATSVQDIEVHWTDAVYGYAVDSVGKRRLNEANGKYSISILPRRSSKLLLLKKFPDFVPEEKFLLDDVEVEIIDINPKFSATSEIEDFARKNTFLVFILSFMGVFLILLLVVVLVLSLATGGQPQFLAKVTSLTDVSKNLALLNWIKNEDEERYGMIVRKAEKIYRRWTTKSD